MKQPTSLILTALLLVSRVALPAADVPEKSLPLNGEVFQVQGRTAFVTLPQPKPGDRPIPWVWYAPTLPGLPSVAEKWMFERFTQAGIAIAGIDVGESYGSPNGRALYSALYDELTTRRGFASKAVLLGRSRGGLMTLAWAAENADKVAGFAGIYPVCNVASYPGVAKASGAYRLTAEELAQRLAEHNPIDRLAPLAQAGVPLFAIHGDSDKVVPLEANSGELRKRYEALGGQMQLIVPPGQGHNMWEGFFHCQALVDFVIARAKGTNPTPGEPTNAKEAAEKKAAVDKANDEKYQQWKATRSADEQAWLKVLEENLGSFYLPLYKMEKARGSVSAWDYAEDDPKLPRVLLIGDSISRGYTLAVRHALAGKANVHRAPENCGPTANGVKKFDIWLGDGKWDLIHFNFGIHDRATKPADYEQRLETIVAWLQKTGAKLIWASSTPLPAESRYGSDAAIVERNTIAAGIMKKHNILVDDLYAHVKPRLAEFQNPNDCHFNGPGYDFLGQKVAQEILATLGGK